jgi:hypothetical protein
MLDPNPAKVKQHARIFVVFISPPEEIKEQIHHRPIVPILKFSKRKFLGIFSVFGSPICTPSHNES